MNIKWISLVAVVAVFSVGCSDSEQTAGLESEQATHKTEVKAIEFEEIEGAIMRPKTEEQKASLKEALSSVEGIPPEKLDEEVKGLVAKISENSDMTEEEAAKLEQDLKSVFQKIEAERTQ